MKMPTWLRGVRKVFGSEDGAGRNRRPFRTPRTRVRLPAVTHVSGEVLRTLREFHQDLDAYVLPDGKVWLLKWEEGKERVLEGRKILHYAKNDGDYADLETAHLMSEGWSLLGELPFHAGISASAMLNHAQMTLYATPKQIEEDHARRRRHADGTVKRELALQRARERLHGDAHFDHSYAYRGRLSFGYNHARFNPFPARSA